MADFTALKTAIQTYIKQNGNEEITGEKLQEILLSVVTTLGDSAINDLVIALADEVAARQNADGTLQQNITNEATARGNADTALSNRLGSTITAENTAADQIGAEAEARAAADTALQNLIDGITNNIANGYVYAGIATPSSTPAAGRVFYLALTAGTYANFGNTEVSQGINILKYNGSTWSLDAFIGIDDTPTPNSPKLVKSGGVAEELALGAVYDVSAKNPTAGPNNDGKWESLSALLSDANLNTLIPTAVRKGGMSIKFVHTSDYKYVKFFCTAQNFTTDVTQWQGVDDVPTAGSDNLVTSGGVVSFIGYQSGHFVSQNTDVYLDFILSQDKSYIVDIKRNDNLFNNCSFFLKSGATQIATFTLGPTESEKTFILEPESDATTIRMWSSNADIDLRIYDIDSIAGLVGKNREISNKADFVSFAFEYLNAFLADNINNSLFKQTAVSVSSLSNLEYFDNEKNKIGRGACGWCNVVQNEYYHIYGDIELTQRQAIIVSCSASPTSENIADTYNSCLPIGKYHINTVVQSKSVRFALASGLSIAHVDDKITYEQFINTQRFECIFSENYHKDASAGNVTQSVKKVQYNFKANTGYLVSLENVTANDKIRFFSGQNNRGYDDCIQYFEDVPNKDGEYYLYFISDAPYLNIQVISPTDTMVNFDIKVKVSNNITEIAKKLYDLKCNYNERYSECIKNIIQLGYKLDATITLSQNISIKNFENGEIRPITNGQWGTIQSNTNYYISGNLTLTRAQNIVVIFNGSATIENYINDFNSYLKVGTYKVATAFNSGNATRIWLATGLTLRKITGLKEVEATPKYKTVVDHLTTPAQGQSSTIWRGIFSMIPKGCTISEFSYKPKNANGSTRVAIWKYDDVLKTMAKQEEIVVTATSTDITHIAALEGRSFDYDVFIAFIKNGDNADAIGWTNDNTGSQLGMAVSNGDSFSVIDKNISGTDGNPCVKLTYECSQYFNSDLSILEVGNGKPFDTISRAALACTYGDTVLVYPGKYLNNNVQSMGKKINIIGIDKYSCILECDTSDYLNPPIEMNIGSICNMTIRETDANPTVTASDVDSHGYDRLNCAYCIHSDSAVMAANEKLYIDNCIMYNRYRPCLGAGLYQDYGIEIRNTTMHSGLGFINPVSGNNGCRGALYVHSNTQENVTDESVIVENCRIECEDNKYATFNGYTGNSMSVTFINNAFWSYILGKSSDALITNVTPWGDSAIIKLEHVSYGNNVGVLNYSE